MSPEAHEQALAGLKKANVVRAARAEARRNMKAGKVTLLEVLRQPPDCIRGVALQSVLSWGPRMGPTRAKMIARDIGHRRLGDLTERQRAEVARRLPERLRFQ